jgi:hypothetical protein
MVGAAIDPWYLESPKAARSGQSAIPDRPAQKLTARPNDHPEMSGPNL